MTQSQKSRDWHHTFSDSFIQKGHIHYSLIILSSPVMINMKRLLQRYIFWNQYQLLILMMKKENKVDSSQLKLIKSSPIKKNVLLQNVSLSSKKTSLNQRKNEGQPSPSRSKLGPTNQSAQFQKKTESFQRAKQMLKHNAMAIIQAQEQTIKLNSELVKQVEDLKTKLLNSQQCVEKLEQNLDNKNKELHQSIKQAARTIVGTADKIIRELYHELDSERKKHSNQTSKDIQMKAEGHFQVSAEVLRQEDENYKPTEQLQATHQLHSLTQTCEQKMNKIRFLFNELLQIKAKPNSTFVGHGVSSNQPKQNQDMIFKSQSGTKNEKKEGYKKVVSFFQLVAVFLTGTALVIIRNKA